MKIFLTGANSHLAKVLMPSLLAIDNIEHITGVDINPVALRHNKFSFHQCDIRSDDIARLMQNHDILIHLAFVVLRNQQLGTQRKDRETVKSINLDGSKKVFTLAAQLQYSQVIHLSSAVVYGAQASNPLFMTETQPLSAISGFSYAEDKVALENWLEAFAQQHQHLKQVIFRPHVILGKYSQPFLIQLLKQPFYPRLPEPAPHIQCIWEQDVVSAITAAIEQQANGIYNLASPSTMSFRQMLAYTQRLSIPLPVSWMIALHKLLWHISGKLEEPGWLGGMRYPLTINCEKARQELGWTASKDIQQVLDTIQKAPE